MEMIIVSPSWGWFQELNDIVRVQLLMQYLAYSKYTWIFCRSRLQGNLLGLILVSKSFRILEVVRVAEKIE